MLLRPPRWLLTFCLVFLAMVQVRAAELGVVIVSSDRTLAYQEAAKALMDALVTSGVTQDEVQQLSVSELTGAGVLRPRLWVALGAEACGGLAKRNYPVPVLCTLLPRLSFERILQDSGRQATAQFSALYLNQPLTRQLDLVRLALPKERRVGVLFGPESKSQEPTLEAAAAARGLKLVSTQVTPNEPVFNGLKQILDDSDVLLAMADPQVYNPGSIQNILLATYRARVPLVAFSPAYVRAGALLAVYSTPAQIGLQAGVMARTVLQGRALGLPEYPQHFTVNVNEQVARSMGLNLDARDLSARLARLERGP